MISYIKFCCILACVFLSCSKKSKDHKANEGLVEIIAYIYDNSQQIKEDSDNFFKSKVWYRDSFAIEEITSQKSQYKNDTLVYSKMITEYFRFNDLANRRIYLFKNFSDTAICYQQYSFDDGIEVESGWGFNFKRSLKYSDSPCIVNDTVINNVVFKQMRLVSASPQYTTYLLCLFRCDNPFHPFNIDTVLSKRIGCPLTTLLYTDSTYAKYLILNKVDFVRDTLTPGENKVFDAWEKMAKENPVKK